VSRSGEETKRFAEIKEVEKSRNGLTDTGAANFNFKGKPQRR
jgi:hypothetical protein